MAHETLLSWLGGQFHEMFGPRTGAAPVPVAPPPTPAVTLEQLNRSLDLLRGENEFGPSRETDDQRKARLRAEREEAERLGAELHRQEMLEDILELHRKLGTGLDRAELDRLHAQGEEWLARIRASAESGDLAARSVVQVIVGLYRRVGEVAWDELHERMATHGVPWPDPTGMSPHADAEDLQRARGLQSVREKADFLETPAVLALDRMLGIVQVWGATYPDRGTGPWVSTALRGVGAALRLRLFGRVFEAARERRDSLREGLQAKLHEKLDEVQALLARGVTSVAEADRISRETERIVHDVAPEYVWEGVKDALAEPAPAG